MIVGIVVTKIPLKVPVGHHRERLHPVDLPALMLLLTWVVDVLNHVRVNKCPPHLMVIQYMDLILNRLHRRLDREDFRSIGTIPEQKYAYVTILVIQLVKAVVEIYVVVVFLLLPIYPDHRRVLKLYKMDSVPVEDGYRTTEVMIRFPKVVFIQAEPALV